MIEYALLPSPVSMNSSWMSRRRQTWPFIRYSLSPFRYRRRVTTHSGLPSGLLPFKPETLRFTSAMPRGWRDWLPPKITSSIEAPRRLFALCSPRTHEIASEMLLFPQPLGPTMPVTPPLKESSCRSQKDLKPVISTCSRRIATPRYCEWTATLAQAVEIQGPEPPSSLLPPF